MRLGPASRSTTSALVLVAAAWTLALAPAGSAAWVQDDAGTGGDAPDELVNATLLAPGTYTASLAEGAPWNDTADWFKLPVPALHGLVVNVTSTEPETLEPCVSIWSNNTTRLDTNGCDPFYPVLGPTRDGGTLYVRFAGLPSWMNYTFELAVVPLPDLTVAASEATTDPVRLERLVNVTVTNTGARATGVAGTLVAGRPASEILRDECSFDLEPLAPGASWTRTLRLPGLATVGDVRVFVDVRIVGGLGELSTADNFAFYRSEGVVPTNGLGGTVPTPFDESCTEG